MRNHGELKAVVVAGDRGKSHPVFGRNKAFLDVHGLSIIARVISALEDSKSVSEIFVVGPKERLEESLAHIVEYRKPEKPIHIYEQHSNLYENVWQTFLEILPGDAQRKAAETLADGPESNTVVLVVAADMPLLTSSEVDEFVSNCDMRRHDYVVGVTEENDLKAYYPSREMPGIRLAYMHFKEGNFRQNNMHMVRPFKLENRHYVQTMYDLRYQKEFGNILRLAWEILKREEGGWGAMGYYLLLQLSLLFARLRLGLLRDLVRSRTHIESVLACISKLMKTRVGYACTTLGGAALDVDKEYEYEAIKTRFAEWMEFQQKKARAASLSSR